MAIVTLGRPVYPKKMYCIISKSKIFPYFRVSCFNTVWQKSYHYTNTFHFFALLLLVCLQCDMKLMGISKKSNIAKLSNYKIQSFPVSQYEHCMTKILPFHQQLPFLCPLYPAVPVSAVFLSLQRDAVQSEAPYWLAPKAVFSAHILHSEKVIKEL